MEEEKKEQKKSLEEMLHEAVTSEDLISKLTPEVLKHWDNIITSILELRKMQKETPTTSGSWLWAIFLVFLWTGSEDVFSKLGNNIIIKEGNNGNTAD